MMSRYTETDLAISLESARGCDEAEGRRLEGICRWEDDAAVVDAAFIWGLRGAAESEVPFEEVVLERCGVKVGRGCVGQLCSFLEDSLDGRIP